MPRRAPIRNWIEYALALGVVKSLEWAPEGPAYRLARVYVRLLDVVIPRLRRAARRNLEMALPGTEAEPVIAGMFRSLARLLVTFAKFPSIRRANPERWIRCEGVAYVEDALRQGRGVLFATAHLGNWELSAFAWALFSEPMSVVARPLDNPLIDRLVERRRTGSGNRVISKRESARLILKALAANQAVGILIDQNASAEEGVFVDFFGVPACAGTGFAKLAAHSGAAVIPGFALWSDLEHRYILRFYRPLEITGDAAHDTQALQARLEEVIRAHPNQWLWMHRRWKTRPPGAPPLYK
jgi:Kdo2-lipid IVA lauroyltransferase/acyltransferase